MRALLDVARLGDLAARRPAQLSGRQQQRVAQIGSPREIYDEPATLFVAGFIGMAILIPSAGGTTVVRPQRVSVARTGVERARSMPRMPGMTGLAYNRAKTGRELTSFADILDPAFKGEVTMQTEMRDTLGLILLYLGIAPERAADADVAAACAVVTKYRENGQIRAFTGTDYADDLAEGNIAIAIGWSGDVAGLAGDNLDPRFAVPKEGGLLFSDCMFIPVISHRIPQAMAWMNYVYQPAVSARIVEAVRYISPVKGTGEALAKTDPALAADPLVNPPPALRARLHRFRPLTDAEERRYTELFYRAMGV